MRWIVVFALLCGCGGSQPHADPWAAQPAPTKTPAPARELAPDHEVVPPNYKESDRDGDGIANTIDKCPDDAEDFDGFQDADGCPDPDNDKDGILDPLDHCPNAPENYNGYQDADGCPDQLPTP